MDRLLADGMSEEAVKLLFLCMERDRGFYWKAFEVTGQNSFEVIRGYYILMTHSIFDLIDKKEQT
ncbi:MAG: hypothetical protein HFI64_10360 [Lachnospiraceae bacterium]|nr:hypothetical protein [Lachnospiraceae bacterium]